MFYSCKGGGGGVEGMRGFIKNPSKGYGGDNDDGEQFSSYPPTVVDMNTWYPSRQYSRSGNKDATKDALLFKNTKFSPKCCSFSSYSNSMGCACISTEQARFLRQRGSNNYPEGEY